MLTTRKTRASGILLGMGNGEKAAFFAERVHVLIGGVARRGQPENLIPILLLDVSEWAYKEEVLEGLQKAGISAGVEERLTVFV